MEYRVDIKESLHSIHRTLFELIKLKSPDRWRTEVKELLGLSQSSVYKKTTGSVPLSIEEMLILLNAYGIASDRIFPNQEGNVNMNMSSLVAPVQSVKHYLTNLASELSQIRSPREAQILYASSELPVFHYMHSRYIFCFKLAVWSQTTWGFNPREGIESIILGLLEDSELKHIQQQILHGYCRLNSTELWPTTCMDNTINQLHYYCFSRGITSEDLLSNLTNDLRSTIKHIEEMAVEQTKFVLGQPIPVEAPTNLTLFHNEIFHTNNTIILDKGKSGSVFITHDSPNYMVSDDPVFYNHSKNWFNNMFNMSSRISGENQRQRSYFFSVLNEKVDHLERRLGSL